jgi:hypothetical protein
LIEKGFWIFIYLAIFKFEVQTVPYFQATLCMSFFFFLGVSKKLEKPIKLRIKNKLIKKIELRKEIKLID